VEYRVAVNVQSQESPSEVEFYVNDRFEHPITAGLLAVNHGFRLLESTPEGGGLDFIRGNLFDHSQMRPLPMNLPGPDNDLNEAVDRAVQAAIAEEDAFVCAFGQRWGPEPATRDKIFGFLPGDDPRLRATVLAIADDLSENGFVLRYRTEETDDGLSGKEGTFVICSFWLVSALAIVGEIQRARDLMERLVKAASPLGLYAEEYDVDTGRHLGNFPQAFSHLALAEAAARIIVAEGLAEVAG